LPTKEELEQEVARLTSEKESLGRNVEDLTAENDRLLDAATAPAPAVPAPAARRPWLSEGERQELERHGVTTSPFDGQRITIEQAREYLQETGQFGVTIADPDPVIAAAAGYTAPADSIDERE
jgi:hypothetical protein